jgi:Ca2+-binding RTX toxin-like protein
MPKTSFEPRDPLYASQWHFQKLGDIERIWAEFNGRGIRTAVYDSGVQYDHPDLAGNYDASRHIVIGGVVRDPYVNGVSDPNDSSHGTSVAGLIAADLDGIGGVGVAFGAGVTGVNFNGVTGIGGTALESEALAAMAGFDVVNLSLALRVTAFGDNFFTGGAELVAVGQALRSVAETGRGGLGTSVVVAASNLWTDDGRAYLGDPNHYGLQSSRYAISVAAYGDIDEVATYSSRGAANLVTGPSSGGTDNEVNGILTTDFTGAAGAHGSDYDTHFGGTSASAPIVAGVVALMYDANERLGWRDVREILAVSARHLGSSLATPGTPAGQEAYGWTINGAANWNGGGMHFSNDHGFGAVDAFAAVRMSEVWSLFGAAGTSATEARVQTALANTNLAIPDANFAGYGFATWQFTIGPDIDIDTVGIRIRVTHGNMPDLSMRLTSPDGTTSVLFNQPLAQGFGTNLPAVADFGLTWEFTSNAFRGEGSAGLWTFEVRDHSGFFQGTLEQLQLSFYGDAATQDDVYHYTAEIADLVALNPARRTLADAGGIDWLNFAAFQTDLQLSLNAGQSSRSDGTVVLTIAAGTTIENAVTGDGDDTVTGNAANNRIHGMRGSDELYGNAGNDFLSGGAGADFLDGGLGNDTLDGGLGIDLMRGGAGNDLYVVGRAEEVVIELPGGGIDLVRSFGNFVLPAEVENLLLLGAGISGTGNDLANTITGSVLANRLDGAGGNDRLIGGLGNDTLIGGIGADILVGGEGADRFLYRAVAESTVAIAGRDRIDHFSAAADDRIDLSAIDAIQGAGTANDVFAFRGTAAFTAAGQVRVQQVGAHTLVEVNTFGAGGAEMSILLLNVTAAALSQGDFVL